MMSSPEDDAICPVHGWMSHVFLHEAAHAVAAIDRDIEFRHVTITTPAGWTKDHPDGIALGGLYLDPPASRWVESQPLKAYEMVLAGSLAEREALGHWLPEGYAGDLRIFRLGAGLLEATAQEALEQLLGKSIRDVIESVKNWIVAEYRRIRVVVEALAGVSSGTQPTRLDYASGPWSLSYAQVVELVT
ncbi:hypothetical protein [Nostocoides sp.]|jgi:hypothetical protein|uniref:hypothetical protein n=1 Tax=Nostocoides sp. TaxID=1917966 RepID=UPI003BB06CE4